MNRRDHRKIPRSYDDGFRGTVASVVTIVVGVIAVIVLDLSGALPCADLSRIAGVQHHDRPDLTDQLLGNGGTGSLSASVVALFAALGAAFIGADAPWAAGIALLTVATAWLALAYAFALRYLRLNAAGERITFDIDEHPRFGEFLAMALMLTCFGALSAGTPRTRESLRVVGFISA